MKTRGSSAGPASRHMAKTDPNSQRAVLVVPTVSLLTIRILVALLAPECAVKKPRAGCWRLISADTAPYRDPRRAAASRRPPRRRRLAGCDQECCVTSVLLGRHLARAC